MTKFLAGVLSVIAVGVLLIAYGLLNPRAGSFEAQLGAAALARPTAIGEQIMLREDPYAMRAGYVNRMGATVPALPAYSYAPYAAPQAVPQVISDVRPVRTVSTSPEPRREPARTIGQRPGRSWKKTALVIGGSSAAGAGVGAIFGGKKGALVGAAIGGGASTIYETTKK
jgi:hypothetical protein